MPMPIAQFQILARNPERAAEFYARLFGWSSESDNSLAYRTLETGGLKGGIWPAPPEGHGMVQLFVRVSDMAATVRAAEQAGGKVIIPPQQLPDGDEMAVILDPEGIPFGLVRGAARG